MILCFSNMATVSLMIFSFSFLFFFLYMRIDPPHFLLHTLGYVGHWFVGPRRYL